MIQHCELTVVQAQYSTKVATMESKDGCPLGADSSLKRTINMKPLSQTCQVLKNIHILRFQFYSSKIGDVEIIVVFLG